MTIITHNCYSQTPPVSTKALDTVVITSSRIESNLNRLPAAVSVIQITANDATRQQTSLQEYLQQSPGIFTQNATNFAQDLRISIRGFGARSSFGIRGIKLIVDGIPETTPDGQGQLDNLNLGITERIEITKGPSSSLYGNASGGVIDITTLSYKENQDTPRSFKVSAGAFGFQNYQATAVVGDSLASYIFHGNYASSKGFRDQSGFEQINTNFKGRFQLSDSLSLTTIINYADAPQADDPGGLTLEEVQADRRQARDRNVLFQTGEAVTQFKVGARIEWLKNKSTTLQGYAFYSNRQFNGLLPFEFGGVVDLSRNYLGQGTSVTYKKKNNTLRAGYDVAYQSDRRNRFQNLEGQAGNQTLGQQETFTNLGVYLTDHLEIEKMLITAGVRFDYNRLAVDDNFLENGDTSGELLLNNFNPSIGVSYAFAKAITPYFSLSSSFETPSLAELSNNPENDTGFNEDLKPQKATNYEIGIKGVISGRLRYQAAFFHIATIDDLVPFELEQFPDREFFRNAGSTTRYGIEVEGTLRTLTTANGRLDTTFSYTYSDFTYEDFQTSEDNFSGNTLPGIPKHVGSLGLSYNHESGFSASLTSNFVGEQFAQDSNETVVEGYELINFRASYETGFREITMQPYFGVNNLLDQEYTDNVRINAFGGRFFEPAPGLNVFGGIILNF